jgi:uncharacterized protein
MLINSYDYKEIEIGNSVKKDLKQNLETYYNLNKHIQPKAKILHLGNDYGQLDVLLALQEPQRKIVSFINDEEKLLVAKTNYIVSKRKILYLDQLNSALENQYDVILISDESYKNEIEKVFQVDSLIILVNCSGLKNQFENFEILSEENGLVVLKKK